MLPPRPTFRSALEAERPLMLFGAYDGLSSRLIELAGGKAMFVSGFSVVGGRYGVPDYGLRAFGDIAGAVADIMQASRLPALVDADNGYGDVKNVVHTVNQYERLGVGGVVLEDQIWPKRCGHLAGKSVVPMAEAAAKIRAAASERMSPDTFILARTDARTVNGLDDAMRRAEAYLKAGADGIFIEALETVEELATVGKAFDAPILANPIEGGRSPQLSPAEYRELGFAMIGYGITLLLRAAGAMRLAMDDILSGRFEHWDSGMSFADFTRAMGIEEWQRIEAAYPAKSD